MKVFVLIMADRDMRPRSDVMTAAVFATREDALAAMENDIASNMGNGQIGEDEIERHAETDYAASADGRFVWKVEERIVRGDGK